MNNRQTYFNNLDGLRTVAFLIVFISHTINKLKFGFFGHREFVVTHFKHGDLGVLLFFVLSGFLITYLIQDEIERNSKLNIWAFYSRRFLRIWPLYFLIVFIGFILVPLVDPDIWILKGTQDSSSQFVPYFIFFLGNFVNAYSQGFENEIVTVLWSVSVEEQFYLIIPIMFLIWPGKFKLWLTILFIFLSISIAFRFQYSSDHNMLSMHTLSVMSGLIVGCLMSVLVFNLKSGKNSFSFHLKKSYLVISYLIVLISIYFRRDLFTGIWIPFEILVFSIFFAWIIFEQTFRQGSFLKISNNRILTSLGKYTYGLYCFHFLGFVCSGMILHRLLDIKSSLTLLQYCLISILALIISLTFAFMSYHFFEKPFLNLKNKLVK